MRGSDLGVLANFALAVSASVAGRVPARRATSPDPRNALRTE
jgi:ABC-type lipoprotein release transport system permease subunit